MSKYTTEVRFICEAAAGLSESVGTSQVDAVLEQSWNSVFTTTIPFFDESYRKPLCKKILKHFYTREIGAETVGLWKLWMNTKLEEIMPYYNQLYKSELLEFNPLYDADYTRSGTRDTEGNTSETNQNTRTSSGDNTQTQNSDSTGYNLFSDTPQGALTGVDAENYLTNATKVTNEQQVTTDGEYSDSVQDNGSKSGTANNTEEYYEMVAGRFPGRSGSKLLQEFRETILNIDMQVIAEFEELFFGLW